MNFCFYCLICGIGVRLSTSKDISLANVLKWRVCDSCNNLLIFTVLLFCNMLWGKITYKYLKPEIFNLCSISDRKHHILANILTKLHGRDRAIEYVCLEMWTFSSKVAGTVLFLVNGMAVTSQLKILRYANLLTLGALFRHTFYSGKISQIVNISFFSVSKCPQNAQKPHKQTIFILACWSLWGLEVDHQAREHEPVSPEIKRRFPEKGGAAYW